jgi:penicillin-binding protein-related factor A (putative recombinase)
VQKLEAKFQIVFKHWVQTHWDGGSAAFELKRTTSDSLPTKSIAPHQLVALNQAFDDTLYHKIADVGYAKKPFDCFVLQQSLAYIVIAFGKRLTDFHIIPIKVWEENTQKRTSVTKHIVEMWDDVEVIKIPKRK